MTGPQITAMYKIPEITFTVKMKGPKPAELHKVTSSKEAANVMRTLFNDGQIQWVEEFILVCLNRQNAIVGYYKVSKGGVSCTVADVRVIATIALNCCAHSVMVAHNHPSGETRPSEADKTLTEKIKEGLSILDIKLLDHIIVTEDPTKFYSFAEEGTL